MWSVSAGYDLVSFKPSGEYLSIVVGRRVHGFGRLYQLYILFSVQWCCRMMRCLCVVNCWNLSSRPEKAQIRVHESRVLNGICESKIREVSREWRNYIMRDFGTYVGRDSSVCIAADYGLDGPGIESQCRRDFPHLPRSPLGPTHPPALWPPGHFPGSKAAGTWL